MDESRIQALDRVADGLDRDRTYVVTQAIDAFLDTQTWQIGYIEEALIEAESGKFATAEEVTRAFDRLRGTRKRKTV